MSNYTVELLKRANRFNLDEGKIESNMIAWANGISPRKIPAMDGMEYARLQQEYVVETLPTFYRRVHRDLQNMEVYTCDCDCVCGECIGLERSCDECVCEDSRRLLGVIPRHLKAVHLIEAGDDSVKLTESITGQDCSGMTISDYRTIHLAIMATLRTGDIPLPESTPAAQA